MLDTKYVLHTNKGVYDVDTESRIVLYTSAIIPGLVVTTNYPKDWGLTRVFQHIIQKDLTQGSI